MRVLLTNDDGVHAKGIQILRNYLEEKGYEVFIVTTDRDRSSTSHALTFHRPIRIKQLEERVYIVDGTPVDSVLVALKRVFSEPPEVIISGINDGPNMGEDVLYSGTLAAAIEGRINDVRSFAVSLVAFDNGDRYFESAAHVASVMLEFVVDHNMPHDTILNVNVPNVPLDEIKGISFTKQGSRRYFDILDERIDPRGRPYYWITGSMVLVNDREGTDYWAVNNRYVAVTPIKIDFTNYEFLDKLKGLTVGL